MAGGWGSPVPTPRSAIDFIGNALLDAADGIARTNGITDISPTLVYGAAADNIVKTTQRSDADLIVIGTRGLSDLGGLMFGSVPAR